MRGRPPHLHLGPDQHDDTVEADDAPQRAAQRQSIAGGHQRVDADHPEWRRGDEHRGEPARHGQLSPDDGAVAEA